MKINPKKSGISTHNGMEVAQELTDNYPIINKENKYKYLGLQIYEENNNKENEGIIIEKIMNTLKIIKNMELYNRNTIKMINTQVINQIRYLV